VLVLLSTKLDCMKHCSRLYIRVAPEARNTTQHHGCGRHVKVLDGSTVSMPDTKSNQAAYLFQFSGSGFMVSLS